MKTKDNSLTKSYKGKFGEDFILRNRGKVSIMAKPPKESIKKPAGSQEAIRERFKQASAWAKLELQNPDTMAYYAAKCTGMQTPYAMAMADVMGLPEVREINVTSYTGAAGDKIKVRAWDKFKVTGVTLKINGADRVTIETGPCTQDIMSGIWCYTATVDVPDLTGVTVTATVIDFPGHEVEDKVTL
ncbi:MAG: hypothetical protein WCR01_14370 [Bacteroidota bacterium]